MKLNIYEEKVERRVLDKFMTQHNTHGVKNC